MSDGLGKAKTVATELGYENWENGRVDDAIKLWANSNLSANEILELAERVKQLGKEADRIHSSLRELEREYRDRFRLTYEEYYAEKRRLLEDRAFVQACSAARFRARVIYPESYYRDIHRRLVALAASRDH